MARNPKWLRDATFYEIYPQTFFDTDKDGIGDIKGIIKKLDYIKDLGFNALWINPLFKSTFFDAGYDVTDFYKVDPRYGTNKDLYRLFEEAHKRGMHVLLDLVPGHTSLESKWFKESCKAKRNEYSDYYIWTDGVWKTPKDLPVIRGFYERDGAVVTNFFSIQPALNYGFYDVKDPSYEERYDGKGPQKVIDAIVDVIRFYLDRGCDGFRCDMAGWLVKRDEDFKGTVAVWKKIFEKIDRDYPEAAFVSEWNCPRRSLEAGFDMDFLLQDEFSPKNSLMTRAKDGFFQFRAAKHDASEFMAYYQEQLTYAEKNDAHVSMITGNHDTIRLRKALTPEEMKLYMLFLFTLKTVPFLYYGDELGMPYEEGLASVEGGYQRTGSRSPMAWDKGRNAGFTKGRKTYIKVDKSYKKVNVESERKDCDSLLNFTKAILSFRNKYESLQADADMTLFHCVKDDPVFAYKRGASFLVAFNLSGEEKKLGLGQKGTLLLSNRKETAANGDNLLLPPFSGALLHLD